VSWTLFGARYLLQGLRLVALLRHRKRIAQRFGDMSRSGRPHSTSQVTRTSSQGIIDFEAITPDLAEAEEEEELGLGLGPDKVRTRAGAGLRAIELARIDSSDAST
jgi:hypothetical protein